MKTEHLQTKLVKMIIVFLLIPFCCVSLFVSYRYRQQMQKDTIRNLDSLFARINDNFLSAFETVNYATASLLLGNFIINLDKVDNLSESGFEQFIARQTVQRTLSDIQNSLLIQLDATPYVVRGNNCYSHDDIRTISFDHSRLWYLSLTDRSSHFIPVDEHDIRTICNSDLTSTVLIVRSLKYYQREEKNFIFYSLPFKQVFRDLPDGNYLSGLLYLIDRNGKVLAQTGDEDVSLVMSEVKANPGQSWSKKIGKKYVQCAWEQTIGIYLIYCGEYKILFSTSTRTFQILTLVFIFAVGLLFLASIHISKQISQPITNLRRRIGVIEKNKPEKGNNNYKITEIAELDKSFLLAQERIQSLVASVRKETEEKESAYYAALQSQIRPHFLFNTLNAIQWKAAINKDEEVAASLQNLGLFLRDLYDDKNEEHTLEEEMNFLDNYVKVINIRFDNKVKFYHILPVLESA